MKLPPGWYALLSSSELNQFEPMGIKRLDTNLVLWRDQSGTPVVMLDKCPHRSDKLSKGKIVDNRIKSAFHGFEYDTDGRCQFVPETQKPAENLRVKTFPSFESNDLIWIWNAPSKVIGSPPWFEDLDDKLVYSQITDSWSCHITRCIESRLDYANLPFIHPNTIGKSVDVTKKAEVKAEKSSILVRPALNHGEELSVQYLMPGILKLKMNNTKSSIFIFSPIDEENTLIYVRTYYKGTSFSLIKEFVDWSYNSANEIMLKELKDVVESQGSEPSYQSEDERLFISDIPIRNFRNMWFRELEKLNVQKRIVKKRTFDPDSDFSEPLETTLDI